LNNEIGELTVQEISGKKVYIVMKHQAVLEAWADIRKTLSKAPILITLDHHTDTILAFNRHLCVSGRHKVDAQSWEHIFALAEEDCQKIKVNDRASVIDAVGRLNNDEHIDAAIRAGIIDHAYVISYSESYGEPRVADGEAYERPYNGIFQLKSGCTVGCKPSTHTDDCYLEHSAQAIETIYLQDKLNTIRRMSQALGISNVLEERFVFDVDLDYFHSARSIAPKDPTRFYDLIRRAIAITVATESRFVQSERLPGESITADWLLERLKEHIHQAQKGAGGPNV
jgi:hypothetical protein